MLQNKNAVIYGAGGSLGGAVAKALAGAGARVFLTGRNLASVQKVADEILTSGGGAEVHDAVVDIEEPMGADNLLWIKHAGHTMSVRVNGSRRFAPGAAVKLIFDMSVASLFDAATEDRI